MQIVSITSIFEDPCGPKMLPLKKSISIDHVFIQPIYNHNGLNISKKCKKK